MIESTAIGERALRRRIETLEEENEALRQRLSVRDLEIKEEPIFYPPAWRLSGQQVAILTALHMREWVSAEGLHSGFRTASCEPDNLLKTQICKLRKKLEPLGVEIETLWGRGYSISPEHKRRLSQAIEAAQ